MPAGSPCYASWRLHYLPTVTVGSMCLVNQTSWCHRGFFKQNVYLGLILPSAPVTKAGKPFLLATAIWDLPLESWPAYTETLAQSTASKGGDYWWQQRNIRELLPHNSSLVPRRLSWGCICDQISNCSPWCAKAIYIPPWPARVVWKQAGPLCFAASSLAEVLFRGQGVILNMTQGLGLICALQLVSCLKQDSPSNQGSGSSACPEELSSRMMMQRIVCRVPQT